MEWLITNSIAAWLLPPGFIVAALAAAWLFARRRPRLARALLGLSLVTLYALSTPIASLELKRLIEPQPGGPLADTRGQAIVVLGGGLYFVAPEYGGDTVSTTTLARVRYAASLHRATGKPVVVTGGTANGDTPEAVVMKRVLEGEFRVPVKWDERQSRTTLENARLTGELLKGSGIRRIYLVTHAWHMARSTLAFEHFGFEVIPAPTEFATRPKQLTIVDFLPNAGALLGSSQFVHEVIGIGWYHLRFLLGR
ncbi:MAG TPA: YdcF family protein [Burkholderiales bacterium]|nr:YdcF family protein [Burkholderiales bacterium]